MTFPKKDLSTSQKKKKKKNCNETYQKKRPQENGRPTSLLNVDIKLVIKVLSNRIKNLLPNLTWTNQNAYEQIELYVKGADQYLRF